MIYGKFCSDTSNARADGSFNRSTYPRGITAFQKNLDEAYRFAHLALRTLNEDNAREWHARVAVIVHGSIFPLKQPFRCSLEPLKAAQSGSMVLGDIHVRCLCVTTLL